jgi:hypothetical protein
MRTNYRLEAHATLRRRVATVCPQIGMLFVARGLSRETMSQRVPELGSMFPCAFSKHLPHDIVRLHKTRNMSQMLAIFD